MTDHSSRLYDRVLLPGCLHGSGVRHTTQGGPVTDETDRPPERRRTRLAVAGAALALGLGALGAAATGAFAGADGAGSSGSSSSGASTTFVQDGHDDARAAGPRPRRLPRRGAAAGRRPGLLDDPQLRRRRRGAVIRRRPHRWVPCRARGTRDAQREGPEPRDARAPAAAGARRAARRRRRWSTWSGCRPRSRSTPTPALWSRLRGFRPDALAALLEGRRVVRTALMRGDDPPGQRRRLPARCAR